MAGAEFHLKTFAEPPQKVRLMFEAVTELVHKNVDIGSLKVSDITNQAGIGKGTAYEYFSCKEEIITLALLYDYKTRLSKLEENLGKKSGFRDKMFCILDWLDENAGYNFSFLQMIKNSSGKSGLCETVQKNVPEEIINQLQAYMLQAGNGLMELGFEEGIYTETDPVKRRVAFAGMIAQFLICISPESECFQIYMKENEAKTFVYEGMIKILNA